MIAEGLAAISLVKASVDFIKSNIDTAKDIGEIAGAVDGLLRDETKFNVLEIEPVNRALAINLVLKV